MWHALTYQLKVDQRVFLNPSKRKIEVNLISSNYHIELTPSDAGTYDRLVIQDILKEIAQTQQVDQNAARRFKIIVINEADLLSRDAQAALRRTMEKYMRNLRLILCANSTSRIIAPIRSRCLLLRVGAPRDEDVARVLRHVAKREKFHLPDEVSEAIVRDADGNMRKAILVLETLRVQSYVFSLPPVLTYSPTLAGPLSIAQPDWQTYCERTADLIVSEQSPARLLEVRGRLYELLVHAIPASVIFKTLTQYLVARVDASLRASIVQKAAFYVCMRRSEKTLTPAGTAQCDRQQAHLPPRGLRRSSHVPTKVAVFRHGSPGIDATFIVEGRPIYRQSDTHVRSPRATAGVCASRVSHFNGASGSRQSGDVRCCDHYYRHNFVVSDIFLHL